MKFIITAHAEPGNGAAKYQRSQENALMQETGATRQQARQVLAQNANGRAPFAPAPGRNASGANVIRNTRNAVRRLGGK